MLSKRRVAPTHAASASEINLAEMDILPSSMADVPIFEELAGRPISPRWAADDRASILWQHQDAVAMIGNRGTTYLIEQKEECEY
jgi:hypothetical protein